MDRQVERNLGVKRQGSVNTVERMRTSTEGFLPCLDSTVAVELLFDFCCANKDRSDYQFLSVQACLRTKRRVEGIGGCHQCGHAI
jgi:hypothetical protein